MSRELVAIEGIKIALLVAILGSIAALHWQVSDLRERVTRVETAVTFMQPSQEH